VFGQTSRAGEVLDGRYPGLQQGVRWAVTYSGWTVLKSTAHTGRCRSVVSREIRRNTYVHAGYQSVGADSQAEHRGARPQLCEFAAE